MVATHLNHLILSHAPELLGRTETQALLDHIAKDNPKLVEDLVPKLLPLASVQRVLQEPPRRRRQYRDMRTIVEVLAEFAPRVQDPLELTTRAVRRSAHIVQGLFPGSGEVQVMALDPGLERVLMRRWPAAGRMAAPSNRASPKPCCAKPRPRPSAWKTSACRRCCWYRPRCAGCCRVSCRSVPTLKVVANSEVPETRLIRCRR